MHIATHLDLDVVALEGDDEISVLVELTAPRATAGSAHRPRTLVVVLDRSGSMQGERLSGAKRALSDIDEVCNHAAVLSRGHLIYYGSLQDLKGRMRRNHYELDLEGDQKAITKALQELPSRSLHEVPGFFI